LMRHDYPGNIRELENIIEHAFILCEQGRIALHHLPPSLLQTSTPIPEAAQVVRGGLAASLHEDERTAILQALARNDYNRSATARELGIHKSTLFRKIKRLGIVLPDRDGRHRQPATTGA
jgi:transcriptional regulator of acetoin/glycerol metabolism